MLAAIAALTVIAAFVRFYRLGAVELNPFYDAAVRSMSQSWHNFFFAAFEPSGAVSIDKPPFELWLQVISTRLFGFNSFALKLPEALAGTLAVPLIFDLIRRLFGSGAGLAGAATLTVLPASVITSRSDTMDSLMMMLLVLTALSITIALYTGKARYLMLAAGVMAVNFDVKLFEAMMPLPALALFFIVGSGERRRRIAALVAVAGVVTVSIGLLWPIAISLAPRNQRAYALGSSNGTIWNSMFVFDGIKRLGGGGAGGEGSPRGANRHNARAALRMFESGARRTGEFFGATLLAAVLFGAAALLLAGGAMLRGPPAPELRVRRAAVAMTVFWLVSVGAALSLSSRLHPRYLEALTPAVTIALGVATAWLARGSARRPRAYAAAIAACMVAEIAYVATLRSTQAWMLALMAVLGAGAVVAVIMQPIASDDRTSVPAARPDGDRWPIVIAVLLLAPLLVSPALVSRRLVAASYSDSSYGPTDITRRQARQLSVFLAAHRDGARYQAVVRTPSQAASLVVNNGLPVLLLQNVGRGPLVSVPRLAEVVRSGAVRYALLGANCGGLRPRPKCPPTAIWVREHGVALDHTVGLFGLGANLRGSRRARSPGRAITTR